MNTDQIAVRVNNLSKIYYLWGSARDRLIFPLKRLLGSLVLSRLWKTADQARGYREFHALQDVSFEIRKGESWGFIGVNGSGKSTLLKIISGNLRPSAGTVEVDGKVAILDYGSGFNGDFTGRENVYLKGSLLGLNRRQLDERFQSIEDFADIGEFIDQPVKTYSSGMSARLGFAIMAHVDADILITDEALAVGDAFFVQKCMRHIRRFLDRGTFLFVSHAVNDVMTLCDKAVWLEHGRVRKSGSAKDVCRAYMDSVLRQNSKRYVVERPSSEDDLGVPPADKPEVLSQIRASKPTMREVAEPISLTSADLARLKNHYAPRRERPISNPPSRIEVVDSCANSSKPEQDVAVGGGRIFSVSITDEQGAALPAILGGEVVCLTIRAAAERLIDRPILGFQIKNYLGLALVGENTHVALGQRALTLKPGDIFSAQFTFMVPLFAAGDYVIRAAFHDGDQAESVAIDIVNEALLLRCTTAGERHGLVGAPLFGVEIKCDSVYPERMESR